MTLTISLSALVLIGLSVALFIGVTVLCFMQGMFDGGGGYAGGLGSIFTFLFYVVFWAVPSLAGWAIWATWWRG